MLKFHTVVVIIRFFFQEQLILFSYISILFFFAIGNLIIYISITNFLKKLSLDHNQKLKLEHRHPELWTLDLRPILWAVSFPLSSTHKLKSTPPFPTLQYICHPTKLTVITMPLYKKTSTRLHRAEPWTHAPSLDPSRLRLSPCRGMRYTPASVPSVVLACSGRLGPFVVSVRGAHWTILEMCTGASMLHVACCRCPLRSCFWSCCVLVRIICKMSTESLEIKAVLGIGNEVTPTIKRIGSEMILTKKQRWTLFHVSSFKFQVVVG